MKILKTSDELCRWRSSINSSKSIGFVPTMGALHAGHLSLIRKSIAKCDISCVSIFINPLQFDGGEDLESYPQNLDGDLKKIAAMGVDIAFIPSVADIYSNNDSFVVTETSLTKVLEGKSRPQFFNGVLTVVSKLFNLLRPTCAYFGMKDAQQLILIEKLVQDMKYPISIIRCETVREHNGLAMSSRNEYLNREQRESAKVIYQSLLGAKQLINAGEKEVSIIKQSIKDVILVPMDFKIDYISVSDINTLIEIEDGVESLSEVLISVAVFVSNVRLIDNIVVKI